MLATTAATTAAATRTTTATTIAAKSPQPAAATAITAALMPTARAITVNTTAIFGHGKLLLFLKKCRCYKGYYHAKASFYAAGQPVAMPTLIRTP
jgi:hypothetical protein